jgi:HlyD family secretion protein
MKKALNPLQSMRGLRRTPWLVVLVLVVLVGGGVFFLLKKGDNAPEDLSQLPTFTVETGELSKRVSATGRVVPSFEVEIKGKASGVLIHLPYDVSDEVEQGDLLAVLDPIDESRQVSQAQANLSGVQSRLAQTQLNLRVSKENMGTEISRAKANLSAAEARLKEAGARAKRLDELLNERYISQEEYDAGMANAAQAQAELDNAQVRLQELKNQELALRAQAQEVQAVSAEAQASRVALATSQQRLTETKIYAPFRGVITSRDGQIGQIIASGINNVSGGTPILTLADLSRIFVLAAVDESDIGQVHEGQPAIITVDAYPGRQFGGKVLRVSPKGFEETNVVTFEVKIEVLDEQKSLLKPEMTANVEMIVDERTEALRVPLEAVYREGEKSFVSCLVPTPKGTLQVVSQRVSTGVEDGTYVEILKGLKAGDKVLLDKGAQQSRWRKDSGPEGLTPGNRRGQRMMMRGLKKS